MSTSGPTEVVEVTAAGATRTWTVSAADVGLDPAPHDAVRGGTPAENAETARRILAGERGAPRDLAVLNAGAALYASGRADSLEAGVRAAEAAVDDGAAAAALERFVAATRELAGT